MISPNLTVFKTIRSRFSKMSILSQLLLLLLGLNGLFIILLMLTLSIPNEGIKTHLHQAYKNKVITTHRHKHHSPYGHSRHQFDRFSECVSYNINIMNENEGVFKRAIVPQKFNTIGKKHPCKELKKYLTNNRSHLTVDTYFRYWHGYQLYTRALLSMTGVGEMRQVTWVLFMLVWACLGVLCWSQRASRILFLTVAMNLVFLTDVATIPIVTPHAIALLSVLGICCLFLRFWKSITTQSNLFVACFAAGTVVNFFDFLFFPVLLPTLLSSLFLLRKFDENKHLSTKDLAVSLGIVAFYFTGYFSSWIFRWAIAAYYLPIDEIVNNITSHHGVYSQTTLRFLDNSMNCLRILGINKILLTTILPIIILMWRARFRVFQNPRAILINFLILSLPALLPFIWLEVVQGHSYVHRLFTCRSSAISCAILLTAAWVATTKGEKPTNNTLKEK